MNVGEGCVRWPFVTLLALHSGLPAITKHLLTQSKIPFKTVLDFKTRCILSPDGVLARHSYKIDHTAVVVKSRCVTEMAYIALIINIYAGRGGGIRTPGPLLPKQMRYQAALRPDVPA